MPTMDELWAEAERLEEPLYEETITVIDGCEWVPAWTRQYGLAALTLANFSDWNAHALRAASLAHDRPDDEQPLCGHGLLIMAALLTEQPPEQRLRRAIQ